VYFTVFFLLWAKLWQAVDSNSANNISFFIFMYYKNVL